MTAIREHLTSPQRDLRGVELGVSIEVYRDEPAPDPDDEPGRWWRADLIVNGEIAATGWAKVNPRNEPNERDELARGEAVVKARHNFRPPINVVPDS